MRSFFQKCLFIIIFLGMIFVIFISLFSLYINHTEKNGHYFSSVISTILKKPVAIESGEIKVFSLYPEVALHDATFYSENNKMVLFHVDSARVTFDLLKSWEKRSWIIKKTEINHLKINNQKKSTSDDIKNKALINWIESQELINFHDIEIAHCNDKNSCETPIIFSAKIAKKDTDEKIQIIYGKDSQKITMNADVQLEEGEKNWKVILKAITIENTMAAFTGSGFLQFNFNDYFFLNAKGSGKINNINLSDIQANYDKQKSSFKIKGFANGGITGSLFPGKSNFSISENRHLITIAFHNPSIAGTVVMDEKKNAPINVKLQRLALQFKEKNSFILTVNPKEIPALFVSVDNFILNGENIGHLSMRSSPIGNGIAFNQLTLVSPIAKITSHGSWIKESTFDKISLSGIFTSSNFGEWFKKTHHNSRVKDGKLNLKFSIETQGAGSALFSLKNIKGNGLFKIEDVTITNKDKKTPSFNFFDSILNLISLQSISNFLTLDFSALKKSDGFQIFVISGDLGVENGYLKTKEVVMKSAVANINFSGNINFIDDQNNLKMTVYPNIIKSEPLGSCPVLAIFRFPVWAWKKISSHFLDPFFNMQYKVTGTLEKPVVKRI